jgi:hypothetical protein
MNLYTNKSKRTPTYQQQEDLGQENHDVVGNSPRTDSLHFLLEQQRAKLNTFLTPIAFPQEEPHTIVALLGKAHTPKFDSILWKPPLNSMLHMWKRLILISTSKCFYSWRQSIRSHSNQTPISQYTVEQWEEVASLRETKIVKLKTLIRCMEEKKKMSAANRLACAANQYRDQCLMDAWVRMPRRYALNACAG